MFEGVYYDFPKAWTFLFVFLACDALCRLREGAVYFPALARFAAPSLKPPYVLRVLKWLAIVMFLVALMSPYKEVPCALAPPPGKTIVIVLGADSDQRTVSALKEFVAARGDDVIGLVAYDGRAFIAAPPTRNHQMLRTILSELVTEEAVNPEALDGALTKGYARFEAVRAAQKVLIILAADHGSILTKALQEQQQRPQAEKVRLFVVVPNETASKPSALKTLVEASGGALYAASTADAVEAALMAIGRIETPTVAPPQVYMRQYYYIYPLFTGFFSLLLYVYMRNRRLL